MWAKLGGMTMSYDGIIAILVFMWGFSFIFLVLRLVIGYRIRTKQLGMKNRFVAADWWLVAAAVLYFALTIEASLLQAHEHKGHERVPMQPVPIMGFTPDDLFKYRQYTFTLSLLQYVCIWSVKAAFLALYFDVIRNLDGNLRWPLVGISVLTAASFLATCLGYSIGCLPNLDNWRYNPRGVCSLHGVMITQITWFASDVLTDIIIMGYPIYLFKLIPLSGQQKIAILFVIAVGSVSPISAIVRFYYLRMNMLGKVTPNTYTINLLLQALEIPSALISCCLPAFRVFFRRLRNGPNSADGSNTNSSWKLLWASSKTSREGSLSKPDMGSMHGDERPVLGSHELKTYEFATATELGKSHDEPIGVLPDCSRSTSTGVRSMT